MSTQLRGPEGATSVQVEGIDYEADESGVFSVDNGEHVLFLRERCGFCTPEEAADVSPLLTDRWPHVVRSLASEGLTLIGVTTGDGLLDVVEARVAKFHASMEEPELPVDPDAPEPEAPAESEAPVDAEPTELPVDAEPEATDLGPVNLRDDPTAPVAMPGIPAGSPEEAPSEESQEVETTFVQVDDSAEGAEDAEAEGDATADPAASDDADPDADNSGEPSGEETDPAPAEPAAEPVTEEPVEEREPVEDPTFNRMNRSGIHAWLVANGGTELTPDSKKDDLIEAAELRVAEFQAKAAE